MRLFVLVASFFFYLTSLAAVDFREFDRYQNRFTFEEVEKKIKNSLEKSPEIRSFYQLTPDALYVGDLDQNQIDYVLYLMGIGSDPVLEHPSRKELKGARIAIDPGHFGGAFAELEDRFIRIPASRTANNQRIYLSEGDLTYATAVELKRLLEAKGAIVFLTREGIGKGAIDEDFFAWKEKHPHLPGQSLSQIFRTYYNPEDLRKRAEKINAFSPDITIVVHYNADLTDSNTVFSQSNYNLAFIPGAFGPGELNKREDRYEFLRLLLDPTIEESLVLSRSIVRQFVRYLDVPLIGQNETTSYIEKTCLLQEPGIYCRNLALTRLVHSPVCYGETLIQNHEDEAYRLSSCSVRIHQVARAYFEGVKRYFTHKDPEK